MKESLQKIIKVLEENYPEEYPRKKFGFYSGCSYCKTTDPELSSSGHKGDCAWKSVRNLIELVQLKAAGLAEEQEKLKKELKTVKLLLEDAQSDLLLLEEKYRRSCYD